MYRVRPELQSDNIGQTSRCRFDYIKKVIEANSPSTVRQDYFSRHPGFSDCSTRLIRSGVEPRVPEAFVALNLIDCLDKKLWGSHGMVTVFDYIQRTAVLCREKNVCRLGRLASTNTAYFWEDYRNMGGRHQFRNDLRAVWRCLFQNNDLFMHIYPKLVTLVARDLFTPAMQVESIPAFTMLYYEMISEIVGTRQVPRQTRLVYRRLLSKFKNVNFFTAPQCRCCNRTVCSEDILNHFCNLNVEANETKHMVSFAFRGLLSIPQETNAENAQAEHDNSIKPDQSDNSEQVSGDPLAMSLNWQRPASFLGGYGGGGLLRRFQKELNIQILADLEVLFTNYHYREVLMNDFLLADLRILGSKLGVNFEKIYAKKGYKELISQIKSAITPFGSRFVHLMYTSIILELIYCIHLRRVGTSPDNDWSYGSVSQSILDDPSEDPEAEPPRTLAQRYWLNVWRIIERHIQRKENHENEENLTPSFLVTPISLVSPEIANWLKFSFELCAINRVYHRRPGGACTEAGLSQVCLEILKASKLPWPRRVLTEHNLLVKKLKLGICTSDNCDQQHSDENQCTMMAPCAIISPSAE